MAVVALIAIVAWGWRLAELRKIYLINAEVHARDAVRCGVMSRRFADDIDEISSLIKERRREMQMLTFYQPEGSVEEDFKRELRAVRKEEIENTQKSLDDARYALASISRESEYHTRLILKYERAARYPWLWVEPDPPEPK
jgi:hypothetical protein